MGKIKCPNCKKEIADNIKFCPKCGEKLENKVIKEKSKSDKKQVVSKIFAFIMLLLMVFASCSTCIYYVVATIQK